MQNIILAAGLASRSGGEKLFYPWNGHTLIYQTVQTSLRAGIPTIVVTGFQQELVQKELAPLAGENLTLVHNGDYQEGQFTSVQRGVEALPQGEDFFIMLGDMPLVREEHYHLLVSALRGEDDGVRPFYHEKPGHPVLLRSFLKPFIIQAQGEHSMNHLLSRFTLQSYATNDSAFTTDIDTWQDYQTIKR